jgi:uncharacterized protein (DUF1778 family)
MPDILRPGQLPQDRIFGPVVTPPIGARLPILVTPVASRHATAALTQAAASMAAQAVESFNLTGAITQARATIAASGKETFNAAAAITQQRATIAASGKETFNLNAALVQAAAAIAGNATNVSGFVLQAAFVQAVAVIAGELVNVAPPETPYAPPKIKEWKPPLRTHHHLDAAFTQQVARIRATAEVTPLLVFAIAAAFAQAAAVAGGRIETGDEPVIEELLLLR